LILKCKTAVLYFLKLAGCYYSTQIQHSLTSSVKAAKKIRFAALAHIGEKETAEVMNFYNPICGDASDKSDDKALVTSNEDV